MSVCYRRIISKCASRAHPLIEFLKKYCFQRSDSAQIAYQHLKETIVFAPALKLSDFSKAFVLEKKNASGVGIRATLSQENHPIAYFSRKLTHSMQKQSSYVRELFTVAQVVSQFCHYLVGRQSIIRTDQEALKHLYQ